MGDAVFWISVALAVTVGTLGGFLMGARYLAGTIRPAMHEANLNRASDHDLLMRAYRRELAQWLFRDDPDRYRALYERARNVEAQILAADRTIRQSMMTRIATDKPFIRDFDLGSREYITTSDALKWYSVEDIEERYLDIVRWQSLQVADDPSWSLIEKPTSEDDLSFLSDYTARLKDTRFKKRLQCAMHTYRLSRSFDDSLNLETANFSVTLVDHIVESRYGIHLKDTNEFGLYTAFHDTDRTYESYYRSSADFTVERALDASVIE